MAKSIRTAIIAAAMTLLLALGAAATGLTAHAATGDTTKPEAPSVEKTVKVAEGVTLPNTTFTYTATQVDNADKTLAPAQVGLDPVTISYDGEKSTSTLTKTAAFDLSPITKTGEYTYEVKETPGQSGVGWTYDLQTYYLQVLVNKDGDKTYTITKTKGDTAKKETAFKFTNTYSKNTSLSVTKNVTNSTYIDKDQKYTFTATFTDPSTSKIDMTKITVTGVDPQDVSVSEKTKTITFSLTDGQTAKFDSVPAGAKVAVEETNTADLKNWKSASFSAKSDGKKISEPTTTATSISNVLVGENENSITVANTFQDTTVTGVITQIAPFVAMIAIAAGAAALYLVSRRRRDA
jgi:hypothetical protein